MTPQARKVMWPVVEEHLDEAEFLFEMREQSLVSATDCLSKTSEWEERLLAHVDGLATAPAEVHSRLLVPSLGAEERGRIFAAALVLFESGAPSHRTAVVESLETAATFEPLVRALELSRRPVEHELLPLLSSETPDAVACALRVLDFRRSAPADQVSRLVTSQVPAIAAAAIRAARWTGTSMEWLLTRALRSQSREVRGAAIETGCVLGLREAWRAALAAVESRELCSDVLLLLLAMSAEDSALDRLAKLLEDDEWRGRALFALGFSGRPRAVEMCLEFLGHPQLGRLAGEVVSSIAGLRLEGAFLKPEKPPAEEPIPFEDESLEAELLPGPEGALPLPEPEAVARWWAESRGRFPSSARFLRGRPFAPDTLRVELARGPMRRRHALALEAAVRTRGRFRLESQTWARAQHNLDALALLDSKALAPFGELLKD